MLCFSRLCCLIILCVCVPFDLRAYSAVPTEGLVAHFTFDGHLLGRGPGGEEAQASFSRHSMASGPGFQRVCVNEPRFLPGKYGSGLLMSPGYESAKKIAFRNYLMPTAAEILPATRAAPGWRPVGNATLAVRRTVDEPTLGLEGEYWLDVTAGAQGDGIALTPFARLLAGEYAFSFHVRTLSGAGTHGVDVAVSTDTGDVLGGGEFRAGAQWQRHEVPFSLGRFTRDKAKQEHRKVCIRLTGTAADQHLAFDAFQLEFLGGYSYAGTRSAADWMPGHAYRAADRLSFPELSSALDQRRGSVAFSFSLHIRKQYRRTLFEIPTSNRWEPHLQLSLMDDRRFVLGRRRDGKTLESSAGLAVREGEWRHVVVAWDVDHAVLFLDGKEETRVSGIDIPSPMPAFRLGSAGPNASAGAVFDDLLVHDRPLTAAEATALAFPEAFPAQCVRPRVCIRPDRFLRTIARSPGPQAWQCTITNTGDVRIRRAQATLAIGPSVLDWVKIKRLAAGQSRRVAFHFVPDLITGSYPFLVTVRVGGHDAGRFRRTVRITQAAVPYENLQVSPWGWNAPRELGFTIGGGNIEEAMDKGLSWGPLKHYVGYPRGVDGDDWVQGMNDAPFRANFHDSAHMRSQLDREAAAFAREFGGIPAARSVTLTSEVQWIWQHDYSARRRDWVKSTFGLDLAVWRYPPKGNADAFQTPFGRLKPSVAGIVLPADRVLDLDDPLYAYHRWFHGTSGPTESLLNQTISDSIHAVRPDILTIQEPILRRCAVRAFDRVSIAQEWYYYENPMAAVMVQERLNAAVRGTVMRPTGMPQFLFKKGRAAPYQAMPTGDMFHETAWLCALQPIRLLTYWNFQPVPNSEFRNHYNRCMTKAQLDELFGSPTPTWQQAEAVLKENPKVSRNMMPWTPELLNIFRRFHTREIGPLGGLIPRWRNRARKIAIMRSFASQLYREVRWPKTTWLENCVVHCGVPFDVLYDEDFEQTPGLLEKYDMLIVSRAVCLTRPAFEAISRFAQGQGVVVTDPETTVGIPGAVALEPTESFEDYERELAAKEDELKHRYGSVGAPQYVEAMSGATSLPNRVPAVFAQLVEERVDAGARSMTPNTWLNVLSAQGVNYVGVVNDLRTRGPMYGHFGKIREQGIPQAAIVLLSPGLGQFAYDVLSGREVNLERAGDRLRARLSLPAGGARLLMLADRRVGKLAVNARVRRAKRGNQRGRELRVEARLDDRRGKRFPGLVPMTLTITRPDGSTSDFSRAGLFEEGRAKYRFPMARNDLGGKWRVEVWEGASGQTASEEVVFAP